MSDSSKRYTDEEFAKVLHAAIKLQEQSRTRLPAGRDGYTLEEMRAAGREAGIEPALIDRAVAMLPFAAGSGGGLLGGPIRYRLSSSVPATATREDLTRAVDAIRDASGLAGKVTTELDGVSWETTGEVSQFHVSMFPRDDGTEVRVAVDRDGAAVLTALGPLAGALVLGGVSGSIIEPGTALGGVALMGAWLAGGAGLARVLWGRSTAVIRDRASRVLDAVTRTLGAD
jgi:hypothetical protein